MKRIYALITMFTLVFTLSACSSGGVSQEEYDKVVAERDALLEQQIGPMGNPVDVDTSDPENNTLPVQTGKFDENAVKSQLEVQQYNYSSKYSNYAFLTIKNNSEYNLVITSNAKFYNDAGDLIGAKTASQEAVESGYDTILYFMPDEKFTKMEYELDVSEQGYYDCVISDLSYEGTEAKNKVILSVTNNGEEAAKFVKAYVLFFSGDSVVGFSQHYVADDDSELKPGKTINKEMDCYEEFDSYQVFFSGRR